MRKILLLSAIAFQFSSGPSAQSRSSVPGKVYTTSWFGAVISVVDLGSGKAVKTIPVGVQDHNIFLSPDQKIAWVTNNNEGTVSLIDTSTDAVIANIQTGHGPRHTNMPADGHVAYVTNEFDDSLAVINPTTRKVVQTVKVGNMTHFPIVAGDKIFVSNFGSADLTVIDRTNDAHTVVKTIKVGLGPLGQGATRDGKRVYVACHASNEVDVIDTDGLTVLARIATEPGPVQVSVAPDQRFAYVATDGRGTAQKIDLSTNKIVKTIEIGRDAGSHGIAFAADGKLLLVTNTGASTLSVIDTDSDQVTDTIKVATAPEGVAFKRP